MDLNVPGNQNLRTIVLPNCKSLLIRQLVLQYVYEGQVLEISGRECSDVQVTHRALQALTTATGCPTETLIDVADCGAAFRFIMALLAVTPGHWKLTGTQRLLERPIEELVQVLRAIGADIRPDNDGWIITGKALHADSLTVNCARSSQFASALLLIAPKIGLRQLNIIPANTGSLSYVRMTLACLREKVNVPAANYTPAKLGLSGDWSAAVFWYAMAMLDPKVAYELSGLSLSTVQGDAVTARWFAPMGVTTLEVENGIRVQATPQSAIPPRHFDVADHPDLLPVMAALACLLPADFTFVHTRNLQFKESHRTKALCEQLAPFSERIEFKEDTFRIVGKQRALWGTPPYRFLTNHDHRLAMAFLLFGKDALLDNTQCLGKSYPDLLSQL